MYLSKRSFKYNEILLINLCFWSYLRNPYLSQSYKDFSPVLSSANFTVSHVKFRYMMYSEFISTLSIIDTLRFSPFFPHMMSNYSDTICWKKRLFLLSHLYTFVKINWLYFVGVYLSTLITVTLQKVLKSARFQMRFSNYIVLYQKCFSNLFLCHLIILKSSLSLSTRKNVAEILIWVGQFEETWHLSNTESSQSQADNSLQLHKPSLIFFISVL